MEKTIKPFKDHFSTQAEVYRQSRPTYPDALFQFLAKESPDATLAWDCATGNGQAAISLTPHFDHILATDASAQQIANGIPHPKIEYRIAPAEDSGIPANTVSLLTAATAAHWFDHTRFHAEAERVLKPGGLLAVWTYYFARISPAVDSVLDHFSEVLLKDYWPPERKYIDLKYSTLPFPFTEITTPQFKALAYWDCRQLMAYLSSWSSTQAYIKKHGRDPLSLIKYDLATAWGETPDIREVAWDIHLKAGKKPTS
ncbi:MAG: class I SAM-dependent methyltransferase [Bacteroidota bacterium]|nr:class I SAM-dependent methyltransferase [Bacteroidota bacterium]